MSERRKPPMPSPLLAFGVTSAALLVLVFVMISFGTLLGPVTALALGTVAALGGVGTAVARLVPAPSDVRIGLKPLELRWLGIVALLVPLIVLTSELDNWIQLLVERPADTGEAPSGLALVEIALVTILLQPVLEEFFFRGVLLQGVASVMRPIASCFFVAALWTLFRAALLGGAGPYVVSIAAIALIEGTLLGVLRLSSGSLFVPMAFRAATAALATLLVANEELLAIPGFNAEGAHTPVEWLMAALFPVAAGLVLVRRAWLEREPVPPLPIAEDDPTEW